MQKIFKDLKVNMQELFAQLSPEKKDVVDAATLQSAKADLEQEHSAKIEELKLQHQNGI